MLSFVARVLKACVAWDFAQQNPVKEQKAGYFYAGLLGFIAFNPNCASWLAQSIIKRRQNAVKND